MRAIRTISVPPMLAAKLDLLPEVNWSAVACRAFEARLTEGDAPERIASAKAALLASLKLTPEQQALLGITEPCTSAT